MRLVLDLSFRCLKEPSVKQPTHRALGRGAQGQRQRTQGVLDRTARARGGMRSPRENPPCSERGKSMGHSHTGVTSKRHWRRRSGEGKPRGRKRTRRKEKYESQREGFRLQVE